MNTSQSCQVTLTPMLKTLTVPLTNSNTLGRIAHRGHLEV